jgi:hypothetical protein
MCWGYTFPGAGVILAPNSAFASIDAGSAHYCGILKTGATKCWGSDYYGEIGGAPATSFKVVRAGAYASCGIRADNSRVTCWPNNLPAALTTVPFSSIDGGAAAEWCAVRADTSKVECWGNSSLVNNNIPTDVTFSQVSVGQDAACGLRLSDGQAQCWGFSYALARLNDKPAVTLDYISVSDSAACGLRADNGEAVCWGLMADNASFHAPRGVAFTEIRMTSHQNEGRNEQRWDHACGVRALDGKVQCWGHNSSGKAEGGQDSNVYTDVIAGSVSACALRSDGQPMCWHRDGGAIMTAVPTNTEFIALGTYDPSCAIRADNGLLQCWNGTGFAPLDVPFESIAGTQFGGCGIRADDGTVTCWGYPGAAHLTGVPVGIPMKAVGVGVNFACALRADNDTVMCWGTNYMGTVNNAPTGVAFDSLSVSVYQACALRTSDGKVQCWGDIFGMTPLPTTSFSSVSVSSAGACGIRADNKYLECWGSVPNNVWGDVAWAPKNLAFDRVSLYDTSACGILSGSGRLVCWGNFTYNPQFQSQ